MPGGQAVPSDQFFLPFVAELQLSGGNPFVHRFLGSELNQSGYRTKTAQPPQKCRDAAHCSLFHIVITIIILVKYVEHSRNKTEPIQKKVDSSPTTSTVTTAAHPYAGSEKCVVLTCEK